MSDPTGTSEQGKTRRMARNVAASNLVVAERLVTCYDQVLLVACQHGLRLPQVETLLTPLAKATSNKPESDDTSVEVNTDTNSLLPGDLEVEHDSIETGPEGARAVASANARHWLRREQNLQRRWRRIGTWSMVGGGWSARRQALFTRLADCRYFALKHANLDRRVLDAFLDEVVEIGQLGEATSPFPWREQDWEARYDVTLPTLQRLGAQFAVLRDAIRHERGVMVSQNRSLVVGIARRFAGKGMPVDDLVQEGTLGLLRAIDKFDPARGFQFSTYAIWWIRQGISRAVLDQGRSVRIPVHLKEQTTRLKGAEGRLTHRMGRVPTRAELAVEVGLSESKVQHLQQQLLNDVSLQRPLHNDGDGELGDNLIDERALVPFQALETTRLGEHLALALTRLDARSRFVVSAHLGLSGQAPQTLDRISQQLGISRERVRQIEREALQRLRAAAGETHLSEYV